MVGITAVRNRSRSRGGTSPVTRARVAGAAGAAAAAPPLPGRPGARPPGWPLPPPCGALPPCGAFGFGFSSASAMALYLVDEFARPAGDPGLLAVGERAHADPGGLVRLRIHQHHVGQVDRPLALDDAALPELLGRALVLLDHVDVLHEHAPLVLEHAQDLALLPALLARHHDDRVTLPHVRVCHARPQITSGAREMILVNCRSRSSRATGPKMRVPTGLSSVLTSTTALRSKRM